MNVDHIPIFCQLSKADVPERNTKFSAMFSEANPLKGFIRTLVNWSLDFKNENPSIKWSCHYLYSQSYEGGGRFSWFPSVWASWVLAGEAVFESSHHPAGDKVGVSLGSVRGKIEFSVVGIFLKKDWLKTTKMILKVLINMSRCRNVRRIYFENRWVLQTGRKWVV